jgi:integrase
VYFDIELSEAVENYCKAKKPATKAKYRRMGRTFVEFCNQSATYWRDLRYHNISDYLDFLRHRPGVYSPSNTKYSNKTIRQHLVFTSAVLREKGVNSDIFIPALRLVPTSKAPQKRRTDKVPFSEVLKLFEAVPDNNSGLRNKAYMALCFGGALRTSEATNLMIGDLKRSEKGTFYVHISDTKNNQAENQIIAASLVSHIERYLAVRLKEGAKDNDPFLTGYDCTNTTPTNKKIGRKRVWEMFWELTERVLKKPMGTHSMRATAISKLIDDGVPYRKIMEFSRHKSLPMVETYNKNIVGIDDNPGKELAF